MLHVHGLLRSSYPGRKQGNFLDPLPGRLNSVSPVAGRRGSTIVLVTAALNFNNMPIHYRRTAALRRVTQFVRLPQEVG